MKEIAQAELLDATKVDGKALLMVVKVDLKVGETVGTWEMLLDVWRDAKKVAALVDVKAS
eukprot:CAMPEP_0170109182 /NCGR_PEP_ID=MMETSP0020_2-20130122/7032_1 /TAXON_ID=98059 /ORGANISM="Dinobryon sp., Strain UTEXLB2267" /LENGTH=59 /DNA_ID=CAMNT_0010334081 /DNA_START=2467 /DNA_END=2646 /DNA_ORIENTATION=+